MARQLRSGGSKWLSRTDCSSGTCCTSNPQHQRPEYMHRKIPRVVSGVKQAGSKQTVQRRGNQAPITTLVNQLICVRCIANSPTRPNTHLRVRLFELTAHLSCYRTDLLAHLCNIKNHEPLNSQCKGMIDPMPWAITKLIMCFIAQYPPSAGGQPGDLDTEAVYDLSSFLVDNTTATGSRSYTIESTSLTSPTSPYTYYTDHEVSLYAQENKLA